MEPIGFSKQYIDNLCKVLNKLPLGDWSAILRRLETALVEQQTVFIAGNGGSAATASHMANDLLLGVAQTGGTGFRAISLTDNIPIITATANDESYRNIFAKQLRALGRPGDVLIAISGSGNSLNLVEAVLVAREIGMSTIGMLGMDGGELRPLVDEKVIVASDDYGLIEGVHMVLNHSITAFFKQWQLVRTA